MVQPSPFRAPEPKNTEDFFLKIAELIQTGSGFPAIYSDDIGMKQLMKKGIPPEKAWDWVGHRLRGTQHARQDVPMEFGGAL